MNFDFDLIGKTRTRVRRQLDAELQEDAEIMALSLIEEGRRQAVAVLRHTGAMLPNTFSSPNLHAPAPTSHPSLQHIHEANKNRWYVGITKAVYRSKCWRWNKHLAQRPIAKKPVNSITESEAQAFFDGVQLGPDGKKKLLQQIRKCTSEGLKKGYLRFCPFEEVKINAAVKTQRIKYYDPHTEIPAIFKHSTELQKEVFGCMYWGAMRKGDVRKLEWSDISFQHNTITFQAKNTKARRTETIQMHTDLGTLLHARWERLGRPTNGFVFQKSTGGHYARNYDWGLDEVLQTAGVPKIKGRSHHGFRHAAAVSAASGVWGETWSEDEVGKLLRDTSSAVKVYFDILGSHMQAKVANVKSQLDAWNVDGDSPPADVVTLAQQPVPGRPFSNSGKGSELVRFQPCCVREHSVFTAAHLRRR